MTHAITASREFAALTDPGTRTYSDMRGTPLSTTSINSAWDRPVLTVRDRETEDSVRDVRELSVMFTDQGLVVNPWMSGQQIRIQGEDLFALRELLAEVPEHAFKRPKDPEVTYNFLVDGEGDWWVECVDHGYRLVGNSETGPIQSMLARSRSVGSYDLDDLIEEYGIDVGVRPCWVAGDIVRECWADGEDVLGRDVEGVWTSVKGTSSIRHTDKDIDYWLEHDRDLGSYSYQVIRRGGVFA
jgi:hypothetical protein